MECQSYFGFELYGVRLSEISKRFDAKYAASKMSLIHWCMYCRPNSHTCLLLARLHIVYRFAVWQLSSSVTLHGRPAGGFTRAGQAMTSCRLQSNYSSTVTLHGGPVVLRPVRATPRYVRTVFCINCRLRLCFTYLFFCCCCCFSFIFICYLPLMKQRCS